MKTGHTYAEASQMTHMNCKMLDHLTPFPTALAPAVTVVIPVIAVLMPVVAVANHPAAGATGGNNLDFQHQVSKESE